MAASAAAAAVNPFPPEAAFPRLTPGVWRGLTALLGGALAAVRLAVSLAMRVWFSVCKLLSRVLSCAVWEAEVWSWVVRVEIWAFRAGTSFAVVVWVDREARREAMRESAAKEVSIRHWTVTGRKMIC